MIFDKELVPKQVTVLDKDDAEIITANFTDFKTEVKLSKDSFDEKKVLEKSTSEYSNVSSELPLYPIALMGSSLNSEKPGWETKTCPGFSFLCKIHKKLIN